MTFTLIEWAKECASDLMADNQPPSIAVAEVTADLAKTTIGSTKKKEKAPVLTKGQKKRRAEYLGSNRDVHPNET